MITYLIIFLSILGLLTIFGRRCVLTLKRKVEVDETPVVEEKEEKTKAKRFSSDEKKNLEKFYNRSLALIKKNEPKEAVKVLVQALAINPDFQDGLKELGKLYLDQKLWGKAAAVYKSLVELTEDPVDYSHLGAASYNAGDLKEAATAYQNSISLDPKRPQRYLSLGQVYRDMEKSQLALIAFNKAVELDKENVDYLLLCADTQMDLGNSADAELVLKRVLELAPTSKLAKEMIKTIEELRKDEPAPKPKKRAKKSEK
ncbi:tetratricopeptide repeat protein [Candidatus Peregrinibacteria bacterium]|jgi:tetratricopeptide (TPR) repeat protein|nr:tetratricopeptide repeat protein [Candidatus Peregrinibacteria bacterium]MBT4055542.1 tetratricopeptide repeat protein [Candidatus Peregrinibacteria bacterium]